MNPLDLLTLAVLGYVGFRLVEAAREAISSRGRVLGLLAGLRFRHFSRSLLALAGVAALSIVLLAVPGLSFGWWTAIGGQGNPVIGEGRPGAAGPLQSVIPVVFVGLLLIGLPLLVEGEEWVFRRGAQTRGRAANARRSVLFGLVHALVGIPVGVAMALSIGGFSFTGAYLAEWRRTGSEDAALAESTRTHLAYDLVIVVFVAVVLASGALNQGH